MVERARVDNSVLIAAVAQLVDSAMRTDHPEKEAFRQYLRACRELEESPGLQRLIITLMGDATAKKVSQALETVKKNGEHSRQSPGNLRATRHCPF